MAYTDFGWALSKMREGKKVCREGWNGKGMWVELVENHGAMFKDSKMRPYVIMKTAQGDYVPWLASQSDILAEDWSIAE